MTARERAYASEMVKERYAVVMVVRSAHRGGGDSKNLVKAERRNRGPCSFCPRLAGRNIKAGSTQRLRKG